MLMPMGDVICVRIRNRKTSKNWVEKRDRSMLRKQVLVNIMINISEDITPELFN